MLHSTKRIFFLFLGFHSLLVGLFPFYIPVYFWKAGFRIGEISLFIAISGLSFCLGLWAWDMLRHHVRLRTIIAISFIFEIVLLIFIYVLGIRMDIALLLFLGLTYGFYNSFFWSTQRALFFDFVGVTNTGKQYGNFQIFVAVSLQAGILVGGFLLENATFPYLIALSVIIALIGCIMIFRNDPHYPETLKQTPTLNPLRIFSFSDQERSRTIFIIDGFYLFLESFFWVITIFLLAHQSFTRLGIIVIFLGGAFAVLFYLIKNSIDHLKKHQVFSLAVILYAASWGLRAITEGNDTLWLLYIELVLITFCTSFFRLAFNKRFFDIAKLTIKHDYLMLKSYYSQLTIAIVYGLIGLATFGGKDTESLLVPLYSFAAGFSVIFYLYGRRRYRDE